MEQLFTKQLPVALFSKKAEEILRLLLKAEDYRNCQLVREANGRIAIASKYKSDLPKIDKLAYSIYARTKLDNRVNTIRTRAQDSRVFTNYFDEKLVCKDWNLFAGLILQKYKESAMRFWFGSKEYDEMVGKPFNPMISAQRGVIQQQIETVENTMRETEERIRCEFRLKIDDLVEKRDAEVKASTEAFKLQIDELRTRLESIG